MKNISCLLLLLIFMFSSTKLVSQDRRDGYLGINTAEPNAALDIKSYNNDGSKVLRVSTIPNNVDKNNEYILLAGEQIDNGYNLRKIGPDELFGLLGAYVPSFRRVVMVNEAKQDFPRQLSNEPVMLSEEVFNSSPELYRLDKANGAIEILETGYYDITA